MRTELHHLDLAVSNDDPDSTDSSSSAQERAQKKAEAAAQTESVHAVDDEKLRLAISHNDLSSAIDHIVELADEDKAEHIQRKKALIARLLIQAARDALFIHEDEESVGDDKKFAAELLENLNSHFLRDKTDKANLRNTALNSVFVILGRLKGYRNSEQIKELTTLFEETVREEIDPDTHTALDEHLAFQRRLDEASLHAE